MKINVVFKYIDPTKGGIENTVYYLYKEFSKKYEVHGASLLVDDRFKLDGVDYFNASEHGIKFSIKRNKWILSHSKDSRCTMNVCMTWSNAIGAFLAKKVYGTPYICLVHGDDVYLNCKIGNRRIRLENRIKTFIAHTVLENADVLCVNSNNTQKLLHNIVSNKNEIIIHPGIHFEKLDTTWHKKDEFVIFSLGRHVERKGFKSVLLAMPEIRKKIPHVKYVLAGDGPMTEEYKQLVKILNLEECVSFVGKVDERQKYILFQNCDLFIMPSFEIPETGTVEGFGMVYIEANMAGRYAVGTKEGGVPDAIQEGVTGHLLNDHSPQTIATDICEIYNDLCNLYTKEMISKRVEWARKHNYENIAKQYEQVMFNYKVDLKFW